MKLTFLVCNEFYLQQLMDILAAEGIDYYTQWENAKGKGRGTEPHLGRGSFASTNAVLMIAFEDTAPLAGLIQRIETHNAAVARKDDRIRLFQMPLERLV
jgi:hypothetical protein